MNTLVILGAGATKSIEPDRIPQMSDFFQKCVPIAQKNKVISLALAECDYERCFARNDPRAESRAAEYMDHSDDESKGGDYLRRYLEALERRFSVNVENLESVMENAFQKEGGAKIRLRYAINELFKHFDSEPAVSKRSQELYDFFFSKIGFTIDRDRLTVVSFNYDLFADRAIWRYWARENGEFRQPNTGRNFYERHDEIMKRYITKSQTQSWFTDSKAKDSGFQWFQTPGTPTAFGTNRFTQWPKVSLVKPHGSLNWFLDKKSNEVILYLQDGGEDYAYCDSFGFRTFSENGRELFPEYEPLIVPPVKTKVRSHSIFWHHDQKFAESLFNVDRMIIIGWSMPETDLNYVGFVERQIERRRGEGKKQIDQLIVIDPAGERNQLFDRFEALFRPKRMAPINKGFSEEAINEAFG